MNCKFIDNNGTFELEGANFSKYLYFPLCNEAGMMSCVTPGLGGDAKLDQNSFILPPESVEDLHTSRATRNFWLRFEDGTLLSATGESVWQKAEHSTTTVRAGLLWHEIETEICTGIRAVITNFVPTDGTTAEVMRVRIHNDGEKRISFTPIAVIPLYGRSAVNQRDHRHVTSLLHRIYADNYGVRIRPTMTFDERGHKRAELEYFVAGNREIVRLYPTVMDVLGESGEWDRPDGIIAAGGYSVPECRDLVFEGVEAAGGLEFKSCTLNGGEYTEYTILIGAHRRDDVFSSPEKTVERFGAAEDCEQALEEVKQYWQAKVGLRTNTGDRNYDNWMIWVGVQPFLRRIMGCSFLPYHDYGKGGRGWRDLWQDCLALLLQEPERVRTDLVNNFAGIRMDGTNATIIGTKPGEFIADRNNIVRVWMDHAVWPWKTTKLYIDKSGDYDILWEECPYFVDAQSMRSRKDWIEQCSDVAENRADDREAVPYGTVLEHLILTHLTVCGDLGPHGNMALRGADWNDALDMAADRGESVAFTAAYAGNLTELADMLDGIAVATVVLNRKIAELAVCLDRAGQDAGACEKAVRDYCGSAVSTDKCDVSCKELASILRRLGNRLTERIRDNERISDGDCVWYNGYYDNCGKKVESFEDGRIMLTSGVFTIMSGIARDEELDGMIRTAEKYLFRKDRGGYCLNTRFAEEEYYASNMGRAFGFAYGQKENGAVFCHMAVMYAYALKKRGRKNEADKVIRAIYEASADFEKSRMYPGIPEYFDLKGRGMYTYLTGAASWLLLYMFEE